MENVVQALSTFQSLSPEKTVLAVVTLALIVVGFALYVALTSIKILSRRMDK